MKITDKWFNLFKSNFFPVFPILKFTYSKKATTFEKKNVQNFGAISDYLNFYFFDLYLRWLVTFPIEIKVTMRLSY